MKSTPRQALCGLGFLAGVTLFPATHLVAQTAAPASPPVLTIQAAEDFLTAAGLQTCEITEMDSITTQHNGAVKSLSIGVAKDCANYDPANPTVVNVHQFADQERRDAMVAAMQGLRFRALRPYGSVWAVDNFVIVLLGPLRQDVEALIKAEYLRRHPGAG
jgi:hypothetical protein